MRDLIDEHLQYHWGVLGGYGISSLTALGQLDIDGNVLPQPGIAIPGTDLISGRLFFRDAALPGGRPPLSGTGSVIRVIPGSAIQAGLFEARDGQNVEVDVAYWAADEIRIAAGSRIVINHSQLYLTLLCRHLVVGDDVVFTWERPAATTLPPFGENVPPDMRKPPKPPQDMADVRANPGPGRSGIAGLPGGRGDNGAGAPIVEMWVLEMEGSPQIVLPGQAGFPGGTGQDGGDGGDGPIGLPEEWSFGFCAKARGAGGDGGAPGRSGDGGQGGDGGHGGRFTLYAPQPVLDTYAQGFYIDTAGGVGGPGGRPGIPGVGGAGGPRGYGRICQPLRESGNDWMGGLHGDPRHGQVGAAGQAGSPGEHFDRSTSFYAINRAAFEQKATEPAIVDVQPKQVRAGERVDITGARLDAGDSIVVDDVAIPTVVQPDGLSAFGDVPADARAGRRTVRVVRPNGLKSNPATVTVLLHVDSVAPTPRLRPGAEATITGSGFVEPLRVYLNGQEMPDVAVLDPHTAAFMVVRPAGITSDETGERTDLSLTIGEAGIPPSNSVPVLLDTVRVLVVGDSVLWGQGLVEDEKIHTLVGTVLSEREGNVAVYPTVLAHSGAIVGRAGRSGSPAADGEVPWDYPTILDQTAVAVRDPSTIDVILLNGGINDIGVDSILDPSGDIPTLARTIDAACYTAMVPVLVRLLNTFDNCLILVFGYYQIVSSASRTGILPKLLEALGLSSWPVLPADALEAIISRSRLFAQRSASALEAAVDTANSIGGSTRVAFVPSPIEEENAVLAPRSMLWGIDESGQPEDVKVAGRRRTACAAAYGGSSLLRLRCEYASIGHPTPEGAQQIAAAGAAVLNALEVGAAWPDPPPLADGVMLGVAASAMQVEGNLMNDWEDAFSDANWAKDKRATVRGDDPIAKYEVAGPGIGHSNLDVLSADLDRLQSLGVNAYRFSFEWSRLQPVRPADLHSVSDDEFDPAGLAYYHEVVNRLLARGMTPIVTLNHFSLPKWVSTVPKNALEVLDEDSEYNRSLRGWSSDDALLAWKSYVSFVAQEFDNVPYWLTLNEPVGSMLALGYIAGVWPPGHQALVGTEPDPKEVYFRLLRAHVSAYDAIKAIRPEAQVGWAHAMLKVDRTMYASPVTGDHSASAHQMDYVLNWHSLNALIDGNLDVAIEHLERNRDFLDDPGRDALLGTAGVWHPRMDFVGVNYYRRVYAYHFAPLAATRAPWLGGKFTNSLEGSDEPHGLLNDLGWEINPAGLCELLGELNSRYDIPLLVTENGVPEADDRYRAPSIVAHLGEVQRAVSAGARVLGYLYWTGVDNWELADGYSTEARFGLLRVDRGRGRKNAFGSRYITEGALAFSSLASTRSASPVEHVFGSLSADGGSVRPPEASLGYLEGQIEGGSELGLLFLPSRNERWIGYPIADESVVEQAGECGEGRRRRFGVECRAGSGLLGKLVRRDVDWNGR